MRFMLIAAVCIGLAGCAVPVYYKAGVTEAEANQELAQCQYEATLATPGYSSGRIARSRSDAIGQGIAEGIAVGMRQAELIGLCMRARSYVAGPPRATAYIERPAPSTYYQQGIPRASEPAATTPSGTWAEQGLMPPQPGEAPPSPQFRTTNHIKAPEPPPPPKPGKFTFEVEQLAKSQQCSRSPFVTLTASGSGFENYSVPCADGDALAVRCDFGNCRVLK